MNLIISGYSSSSKKVLNWILTVLWATAMVMGFTFSSMSNWDYYDIFGNVDTKIFWPIFSIFSAIMCFSVCYRAITAGKQSIEVYENTVKGVGCHITSIVGAIFNSKPDPGKF